MTSIAFGLVFALAVFSIVYIIFWSVQNDSVEDMREQKGLLRMKASQPEKDGDR